MKYPIPSQVPLPSPRPDQPAWAGPQAGMMAAPPAPIAPQQQNGGMGGIRNFLSRNSDALAAMSQGLLSGRTGAEQWAGGMNGLTGAVSDRRKKKATLEWLNRNAPEYASAVESGALTLPEAYKMSIEAKKPQRPNFINAGNGQLFNENTGEWISAPGGSGNNEYGLTPQTGVDAQGNPVLIQLGKGGVATQAQLPEGITLSKEPIKLDAGTHFVLLDPITRQPVGQIPKDLAGVEAQKAAGQAQGEAQAAVPATRGMAALINSQIQSLKTDPYLPKMLGPIDSRLPNVSEDAARVQGKIAQLQGGAFLQARQMLKGGGAITDYEGQKAEAAFARMGTAQSVSDFNAALDEFNAAVQQGLQKLEMQAGGAGGVAPGPRQTSTGVQWSVE